MRASTGILRLHPAILYGSDITARSRHHKLEGICGSGIDCVGRSGSGKGNGVCESRENSCRQQERELHFNERQMNRITRCSNGTEVLEIDPGGGIL